MSNGRYLEAFRYLVMGQYKFQGLKPFPCWKGKWPGPEGKDHLCEKFHICPMKNRSHLFPEKVKICLVSLYQPIHYFDLTHFSWRYDIARNLAFHNLSHLSHVENTFQRAIKEALTQDPDFIICNEMCYPNPKPGRERPAYFFYHQDTREFIQKLVGPPKTNTKKIRYILAGTHHNLETYHNFAMLFHNDPAWSTSARGRSPILHAKRTTAPKTGEFISVPTTDHVRIYLSEYGNFVVLVCLDVFNSSCVLPLLASARRSAQVEKMEKIEKEKFITVDMIFVPSYWPSKKGHKRAAQMLDKSCEYLSLLTGTIVGYTNGADQQYSAALYVGGVRWEENWHNDGNDYHVGCFEISKKDLDTRRLEALKKMPGWYSDVFLSQMQKEVHIFLPR